MATQSLIEWARSTLLQLSGGQHPLIDSGWVNPDRHCFLLLDCSGSMQGTKFEHAKVGTLGFAARALAGGYAVGLIRFASNADVLCSLGKDMEQINRLVPTLYAGGNTNMDAAINLARTHLYANRALRAITLVTDGLPDCPQTTLLAAEKAKEEGIQIIAIGTENADLGFLRRLASAGDLALKVHEKQLAQGITDTARLLPGRSTW